MAELGLPVAVYTQRDEVLEVVGVPPVVTGCATNALTGMMVDVRIPTEFCPGRSADHTLVVVTLERRLRTSRHPRP